eukprot:g764.t1
MATVVLGQTLSAEVEAAIAKDPALKARLDEAALLALARANPERAVQVIEELQNKSNVRNPSAFVAATLAKNPTLRTSSSQPSAAALQQAGSWPWYSTRACFDKGRVVLSNSISMPLIYEVLRFVTLGKY